MTANQTNNTPVNPNLSWVNLTPNGSVSPWISQYFRCEQCCGTSVPANSLVNVGIEYSFQKNLSLIQEFPLEWGAFIPPNCTFENTSGLQRLVWEPLPEIGKIWFLAMSPNTSSGHEFRASIGETVSVENVSVTLAENSSNAFDVANNQTNSSIEAMDSVFPRIEILSPKDGFNTSSTNLTIQMQHSAEGYLLTLMFDGEEYSHESFGNSSQFTIAELEEGVHEYMAQLTDVNGGVFSTQVQRAVVDASPPDIVVEPAMAPVEGEVAFGFRAEDAFLPIYNCTLEINSEEVAARVVGRQSVTSSIGVPLNQGAYNYSISCTDLVGNKASSPVAMLEVGPPPDVKVNREQPAGVGPNKEATITLVLLSNASIQSAEIVEDYPEGWLVVSPPQNSIDNGTSLLINVSGITPGVSTVIEYSIMASGVEGNYQFSASINDRDFNSTIEVNSSRAFFESRLDLFRYDTGINRTIAYSSEYEASIVVRNIGSVGVESKRVYYNWMFNSSMWNVHLVSGNGCAAEPVGYNGRGAISCVWTSFPSGSNKTILFWVNTTIENATEITISNATYDPLFPSQAEGFVWVFSRIFDSVGQAWGYVISEIKGIFSPSDALTGEAVKDVKKGATTIEPTTIPTTTTATTTTILDTTSTTTIPETTSTELTTIETTTTILMVGGGGGGGSGRTPTTTVLPQPIVTGRINPSTISAGENTTYNVSVQNLLNQKISDVNTSLNLPENFSSSCLLPGQREQSYCEIPQIKKEGTGKASFVLFTSTDLASGAYEVSANIGYTDSDGSHMMNERAKVGLSVGNVVYISEQGHIIGSNSKVIAPAPRAPPIQILDSHGKPSLSSIRLKTKTGYKEVRGIEDVANCTDCEFELTPRAKSISKIVLRGVKLENQSINLRMDDVSVVQLTVQDKKPVKSYAIDPSSLNFTNGSMTSVAAGSELWKCADWNFSTQKCLGTWVKLMDIVPGQEYSVEISPSDPGFAETGVASINTKRPIYHPNDTAEIIMVVLDTEGYLVNGASVELTITTPNGAEYFLSTVDGEIVQTDRGIYEASFSQTSIEGDYALEVSATSEGVDNSMASYFRVAKFYDFDIIRASPVTIDPWMGPFESSIQIISHNYSGDFSFTEVLPGNFTLESAPDASVRENGSIIITWNNLTNGSVVSYTANSPLKSPELYTLGPGFVEYEESRFDEARPWYLAVDPASSSSLILFWDRTTNTPNADWECLSCGSGDFYQKFPKGAATYGGTGGRTTHKHSVTFSLSGNPTLTSNSWKTAGGSTALPSTTHKHNAITASNVKTVSLLPKYRELKVIRYKYGVPATLPAGVIAMFNETLPTGWTAYSTENDCMIRGGGANTTGGVDLHTHQVNFTVTTPTGTTNYKGGTTAFSSAAHTHTGSGNSNSVDLRPQYRVLILGKATATARIPDSTKGFIGMFNSTPPGGWSSLSGAGGVLNARYISANATYGATGGTTTHSHTGFIIRTNTGPATSNVIDTASVAGVTNTHQHDITLNSNSSTNNPSYRDVVFAYARDVSGPSIYLNKPTTNKVKRPFISFNFTPSDATGILNCSLIINGDKNKSITVVNNNVQNTISETFVQGTYTWTVNCTDTNGYKGTNSTRTVIVDTTGPVIALSATNPNNWVTNNNDPLFYYNVTDTTNVSSCKLIINGATVNTSNSISKTVENKLGETNVAESTTTWKINCTDVLGNVDDSDMRTITVDTINPTIALATPANLVYLNSSSGINFVYTPVDNHLDTCMLKANYSGAWGIRDTDITPDNGIPNTFGPKTISEGSYKWNVYCNDTATNIGKNETNRTIVIDLTDPTINYASNSPVNKYNSSQNRAVINVTHTEKYPAKIVLNFGGTEYKQSYSGAWSYFNMTGLSDRTYSYYVWLNDTSHRQNQAATRTITIDTTPPKIALNTPANNKVKHPLVSFNFTPKDSNFIKNCSLIINGHKNVSTSSVVNNSENKLSETFVPGTYTWTVNCTDIAGLKGTNTSIRTLFVDTSPPMVALNSPANLVHLNYSTGINFYYTPTDAHLDTCMLKTNYSGWGTKDTDFTPDNGVQNTFGPEAMGEGSFKWNVYCNDTINNIGKNETNRSIVIDLTNPLVGYAANSPVDKYNSSQNQAVINITHTEKYPAIIVLNFSGTLYTRAYSGAWTNFSLTGLSDKTYSYYVWLNDTAHRNNQTPARTIIIDTTAPKVALNAPRNNKVKSPSVSFNFTPKDSNYILNCSLIVNGQKNVSTSSVSNNTINTLSESFVQGSYTWTVNCTDIVGLIGTNVSTRTVIVDTTGPQIALSAENPNNKFTNIKNQLFYFNVTDTTNVSSCALLFDGAVVNTSTSVSKAAENVIGKSNIADDTYDWKVNCTDVLGNTDDSEQRNITIDTTGPEVTISNSNPPNQYSYLSDVNFYYNVSDEVAVSNCQLLFSNVEVNTSGSISKTSENILGQTGLPDDKYNWKINCTDSFGNEQGSTPRNLTIRTTGPLVGLSASNPNNQFIKVNNQNFYYNVTSGPAVTHCDLLFNGAIVNTSSSISLAAENILGKSGLADTTYNWKINCTDEYGLEEKSDQRNFTVDVVFPLVALNNPADLIHLNYSSGINFNYTPVDTRLSTCMLKANYSGAWGTKDTDTSPDTGVQNSFGPETISEGSYKWNVYCNDKANNIGKNETNRSIVIDLSNPRVGYAANSPVNKFNSSQNEVVINITHTEKYPAKIVLNFDGTLYTQAYSGAWTNFSLTGLSERTYSYYAWVNDTSHRDNQTVTRYITIDTTAPKVGLNAPRNNKVKNSLVAFNFTPKDSSAIRNCSLIIDGNKNASKTPVSNNTQNTITESFVQGTYTWTVNCSDTAGNKGTNASTRTLIVDTTGPQITLSAENPNNLATNINDQVFYYNVTDTTNVTSCKLIMNGATVNTSSSISKTAENKLGETDIADSTATWKINCTDAVGNVDDSDQRTITVDTTNPAVALNNPANPAYLNYSSGISFYYTPVDSNLDTCMLKANYSGAWGTKDTDTSPDTGVQNSFGPETISEGSYKWNVYCNDTASNNGHNETNRSVVIDLTNPRIGYAANSPANNYNSSVNHVVINVTHTEKYPAKITLNFSGTIYTRSYSGAWTNFSLTGLSDKTYSYYVWLNDTSHRDNQTPARTITIDTIAPKIALNTPANNEGKHSLVSFNFTPKDSNYIRNCSLIINGLKNVSTSSVSNNTQNTLSENFVQGTYTWTVNCTDTAGLKGTNASVRTLVVDTQNPTVALSSPANSAHLNYSTGINFIYTPTDAHLDSCMLKANYSGAWGTKDTDFTPETGIPNTLGPESISEGSYKWNVYCNDTTNNTGKDSTNRSLVIDLTNPQIGYAANSPANRYNSSVNHVVINVTHTEKYPSKIVLNFGGTLYTQAYSGAWTNFSLTGLSEGTYSYYAITNDTSHRDNQTAIRYITIDTLVPKVALNSPRNNKVKSPLVSFNFTPKDSSTIRNCSLIINGDKNVSKTPITNNTINTITETFVQGTYTWTVNCTDTAGNKGTNATTRTLLVDTSAPQIALSENTPNGFVTTEKNVVFYYNVTDTTNVSSCSLYFSHALQETKTVISKTAENSFSKLNLADGRYTWRINCTDALGNLGHSDWRNLTETSSVGAALILLWDRTTDVPNSDWECLSCGSGDFYQKFIRGAANYGGTGGKLTHTQSVTASVAGTPTLTSSSWKTAGGSTALPSTSHTHNTLTSSAVKTVSILPKYRELKVIRYKYGVPATLPAGVIALFNESLPSGWAAYAAENDYMIRGGSANSTGGIDTHTHQVNFTVSTPTGTTNYKSGTTAFSSASHTHTGTGNSNSADVRPQYRVMILGKANSATAIPDTTKGFVGMFNNTPPAGWTSVSGAGAALNGRYVTANATYGTTGGTATHSHTGFVIRTSTGPATANVIDTATVSGVTNAHQHDMTLNTNASSNNPVYRDVIFGYARDVTGPTVALNKPTTNKVKNSFVSFNFTPSDATGIKNCTLIINDELNQSNQTQVQNNVQNTITESFVQGTYTWNVQCIDTYGHFGTNNTDRTLIVDTTGPQITLSASNPNNQATNLNDQLFYFNVTDTTNVSSCKLIINGITVNTSSSISKAAENKLGETDIADSTTTWKINCTDAVNNVDDSDQRTITVDTLKPAVALNNPANLIHINYSTGINFYYTPVDFHLDTCMLKTNYSGWGTKDTDFTPDNGVQNTFGPEAMAEGSFKWNVYCNDTATNVGKNETNRSIVIDLTNPRINYASNNPVNKYNLSQNQVVINVTHTEKFPAKIVLNFSGAEYKRTYTGAWTNFSLTGLSDATYWYYVWLNDTAHRQNQTPTRTITIDTIAPKVALIAPKNNQVKKPLISFNFTPKDSSFIRNCSLKINGNKNVSKTSITNNTPNTISETFVQGTYTWTVDCTDTAGITGTNASTRTLIVDTTGPQITLSAQNPNNQFTNNNDMLFYFNATDTTNISSCKLLLNGATVNTSSSISEVTENVFGQTGILDDTYDWRINCTDVLGNVNDSSQRNFTVDTVLPWIELVSPVNNFNTTSASATFNWTPKDNSGGNLECNLTIGLVDVASGITVFNNTGGNFTSAIGAGYNFWNATCTDRAGNSNTSATRYLTRIVAPGTFMALLDPAGERVLLNWSSVEGAIGYRIFVSDDYEAGFPEAPNATTSSTNWTDAASESKTERYYRINAIRGSADQTSATTVGKMERILNSGWNLVGMPLNLTHAGLGSFATTPNPFKVYRNQNIFLSAYKYVSDSEPWEKADYSESGWSQGEGSEGFTAVTPKAGYWLETNETGTLIFVGRVMTNNYSVSLNQDWNVVDWGSIQEAVLPSGTEPPAYPVIVAPTNSVNRLYVYKNSSFQLTNHFSNWGWYPAANTPDFTSLEPTYGYYMKALSPATWTVDAMK